MVAPAPHLARCHCDDQLAAEVAARVAAGQSQWEASIAVYDVRLPPPPWDAGRTAWSTWVTRQVAAAVRPLARKVGLA